MTISAMLILLLTFIFLTVVSAEVVENRKVYIVYLGERQHEDPELTDKSHHDILAKVVGSNELASELMVYNYKHGFSGFAAKITKAEALKIAEQPDVVHVARDKLHRLQTTRSWDYLGLSSPMPNNLLGKGNMGDGIIIGVIDSGIWPESKSFSDEGLGPIPSKWKGICVSGDEFNATQHCNKKIIGAQYFMDSFLATQNDTGKINMTNIRSLNLFSPRDEVGHGTHVASIAAGSYVGNVSCKGLGVGTIRGGAPKARIAAYKVGWKGDGGVDFISEADVAKAIDQAIHDGVDVLQISLAGGRGFLEEVDDAYNKRAIYSFHAVRSGIPIVFAGGNDGPAPYTIDNTEPWGITVGASTIDRDFFARITLGNNQTFNGRGIFAPVAGNVFKPLVVDESCDDLGTEVEANPKLVTGKVVFCIIRKKGYGESIGIDNIIKAGAAGLIVARNTFDVLSPTELPSIEVSYDVGTLILRYGKYHSNVTAHISPVKVIKGRKYVSTKVASFSSRGPNVLAPAILKPDIVAPGVNILAAVPPDHQSGTHQGFYFMSGTSMAAPHVSGIIATLKASHPNWSPAALKSALMTTAWRTNPNGRPIFAEGQTTKIADAFDIGAGVVNPNRAVDPGLVYDMDTNDYVHYLCANGYESSDVFKVTSQSCPYTKPSLLDVNLPSITIPSLMNSTTLTRTVTNVGPMNSVYKAIIDAPSGTAISIRPELLVFNVTQRKISFEMNIYSVNQERSPYYSFGSLTWTDGVHIVRSPVSVKLDAELPF